MVVISVIWFFTKRMPRIFALIFNIITIFLLIFLLIGCYNPTNVSTFLVKYTFDESSPFYSIIEKSYEKSNTTLGLENVIIRSGYMGVCIDKIPSQYSAYNNMTTSSNTICYPRKDLSSVPLYKDLEIQLSNIASSGSKSQSSVVLDILKLAQLTSVNVLHPYILMATIILTILMFLFIVYVTVPKLPFKLFVNRFLLLLSPALVLTWGLGAMWTHVGINGSYRLVPSASMNIIDVKKGKKAATMAWFSFAFLLLDSTILWLIYLRDRKSLKEEIDNVPCAQNRYNNYTSSDSSTLHSKV
ncbi:Fig1p [Saccharomyces eubayanus]|uniref:Fig1p n=1 Tax=Saccharomyces eubayanus TaxID=1080349 RepID=UPI0006C31537|nr:FIG1-like protein [Saccharomyces eubayanus]KOH00364.1 FIG1-like protein [Saccharomyces eubayanus]